MARICPSCGVILSLSISLLCLGYRVSGAAKRLVYHVSPCFCVFYLGFYLDARFYGGVEWD